jgi:ribose 5-phosphate isomerase B
MMSIGERLTTEQQALSMLDIWLSTPFEGGRHERRLAKLDA